MTAEDFVRLPGGGWDVWKGIVLRGAGFPVGLVARLGDADLAAAADNLAGGEGVDAAVAERTARFDAAFACAVARAASVTTDFARDPLLREAVTWQNRQFVDTCLDRAVPAAKRDSRTRRREMAIANYVQRYATKNESIGFFGPIGWASWDPAAEASSCRPADAVLGRRTVYFESWAIDAVAATFAARPELLPGLQPRHVPANLVSGRQVHRPTGPPRSLTDEQVQVLELCDGIRTVREIALMLGWSESAVVAVLRHLTHDDIVRTDFGGPIEAMPEARLRQRLSRLPDDGPRSRALAELDTLVRAKDAVAKAAGDPNRLAVAMKTLEEEFERLTGTAALRLHGRSYAGRTLVYEDTVRDIEVTIAGNVLRELGEPLSLILDSAHWLVRRIGDVYLDRLRSYYERKAERTGRQWVPLGSILALATRDFYTGDGTPALAARAVMDLQQRWVQILAVPSGVRRHDVAVDDIAGEVHRLFAADAPSWSSGRYHSPDIMVAAASIDAMNRGDFLLVLSELHLGFNTVESRALVEQSPDPGRLLMMAEAIAAGTRILPVAPRAWGAVTARTSPPSALVSPAFTYYAISDDDVSDLPGPVLPLGALEVGRDGADLVVRVGERTLVYPLAEVVGDYLSRVAVNAFQLLPPARHTPRITVGRLVVARESWRVPIRNCDWIHQLDERRRYVQMRQWVARLGLPRHAFFSVAIETKPVYVDFTSITLTSNLAAVLRRMARERPDGVVLLSEMLPDAGGVWLSDTAGNTYTSELRMVVSEHVR
jgi:Lantibiotic dehydratase, N terminus